MQSLPGFRDFYPEDCARRNYILTKWREVARRYGFVEFDGPPLEAIELYKKKSGGELVGQLFDFVDKGERHVALRPEMTPTLARMVAARGRDFKKPLKWFCVPQFFRYEKQQRGRLREFYQLNCDIIGEASPAADAEMIAVLIDTLRAFGLTENDFVVRLSDRDAWTQFATSRGVAEERVLDFLTVIDKLERDTPDQSVKRLGEFGVTLDAVRAFIADPSAEAAKLAGIRDDLRARGLATFIEIDLTIVRGLAYYTGLVFEVFDRSKNERALAGGGRYDKLLHLMSDGKVDLPALGFGMGDVVLANLIDDTPAAAAQRDAWLKREHACDIYVVIAKEERRPDALALVQRLRDAGQRVDFPLTAAKVGKQFQTAEQLGATRAVLVGDEWPQVKVKTLATREERLVSPDDLATA
ncbi:MAG TPA: histidine--tRNA ligase, partial [Chthoniobacteraceae bacterium]|nr:histidine--tRNA ligase [Chthoniobacteraceae bacterium]